MIKEKYLEYLINNINKFRQNKKIKFFIFGSSLQKEHFGDIDIGVMGDVSDEEIAKLKEEFENSTFPYFVEIINFNKVSNKFKQNVFNNKILWIKH